ncbi:ATP-binding protein [Pseudomonas sp.]|uniref:ATP-binding protein n=1 Tax=Pseudomonas sp. TaxID=306 RepID=UPI00262F4AB5|nr:ATP-binding protein [Pseudomonas sp.]
MNVTNRRILLIDDTPSIHEDYRKILTPRSGGNPDLDVLEAALFGDEAKPQAVLFETCSAYSGQQGLEQVRQAKIEQRPFAMAFVDMRMPQGWDGVETIEHLWKEDPRLQVVICTAYTDYSWGELLARLESRDRLLILKKPFDNIEVTQLANALTSKWEMTERAQLKMQELETQVDLRTQEFKQASQALQSEIDERKQLEGQLVQSEKLASLGQLAAGIAHEINNPIGFISSNLGTLAQYFCKFQEVLEAYKAAESQIVSPQIIQELRALKERLDLPFIEEEIPLMIQESRDGAGRAAQIVKDLKEFSRVDAKPQWQWANLQRGIDSTLNIVANEVKYKADVIKDYQPLPDIECLPSQINQVIMNLVVNAAQAIGPERGTITLRNGVQGERVWLEVSDTGTGIAPDIVQKIFDPFFTTKPVGQGTGLGLSLSYGIVQKHGGHISVQSTRGVGTTFRVELPIRQPSAAIRQA